MAEPPNSNPSFTNREKDRHDPDVKSEEDAEVSRLREAARVRRAVQEAYCKIPRQVYDKAREHPDQLTNEERQVFLNCGDVLGKVVAYPDSATTEEIYGSGPWPYFNAPEGGLRIFMEDTGFTGTGILPAWSVLPEEQKEAYRARAEARRRDAWAAYEGLLAQKDAMSTLAAPRPAPTAAPGALPLEGPPRRHDLNPSPRPIRVYGFELFRDEIVAGDGGLGFWEVLARWEALPGRQQALYDNRARQIVRAELEAECDRAKVIAERQAAARAAEADAGGCLES
ncbi:hypothetical protein NEMBOFW57_009546 [Staphylotrichum longicolle]|uniref:Uncharacterized protein n=1 Tax=Staphylotrichum longicolle TaxID=669026 RepID=A0AAD4EPK0_9PEZI|nr:hypothetical protein NEMBOFW57_009546 [Staphylotrichum longicolle]